MRNSLKHIPPLILILTILMVISLGCANNGERDETMETGLPPDEINNEAFADIFPLQYQSYLQNDIVSNKGSFYNGAEPITKFDQSKEPNLPILFNGYGFSIEYNEDRGHTYAIEDIKNTARITDKSIGSCMTCKSTAVPQLIEELGDDYWIANFEKEILPRVEEMGGHVIGCSDCHEPTTMELRVTRPSFVDAMARQGVDISEATKNEMRTYVCAQCHVEYYFPPALNKKVTFPWDKGFKPEEIYQYYEEVAPTLDFTQDWIHNVSGAPMLKGQHPDYETWVEGPHGKAGVSCSDCHMPYERVDGKKKISSHHWQSTLDTMEKSCQTCHADKSVEYYRNSVKDVQDTNMEALHKAQDISVTAHYYINRMITAGVAEERIKEAQQLIRKGQWLWDFVAAENSTGFHNPLGAMDSLKKSVEASNEAIVLATEELVKLDIDMDELRTEIEKVKKAVYAETDPFKKHNLVTNDFFPGQKK